MSPYSTPRSVLWAYGFAIAIFFVVIYNGQEVLFPGTTALTKSKNFLQALFAAGTFGVAVLWLVSQWLWNKPPISWMLRIPDFSGRWEGWAISQFADDWVRCAIEYRQSGSDISARAWTELSPDSETWSIASTILVADARPPQLAYITDGRIEGDTDPERSPRAMFRLTLAEDCGVRILRGDYCSDRKRISDGTRGTTARIEVAFKSLVLMNGLGPATDWGMPKPEPPKKMAGVASPIDHTARGA